MRPSTDVLIAGGGLAGSLVALALAEQRPDLRVLLVEQGNSFGGQHIWSFFDSDVGEAERSLLEPLVTKRWEEHEIAFPKRRRELSIGYNSIRSSQLDSVVRQRLRPDEYRLNSPVRAVESKHVVLADGERLDADLVLDARGFSPVPGVRFAWQKFLGRTYSFDEGHGCTRPVIMDARVEQNDGFRFVYLLPFGKQLLIEDTYYSDEAELVIPRLGAELDRIATRFGGSPRLVDEESGVLPVVLDGEAGRFWDGATVPRLGIRGGFFHPTTGYSLADAARNALFVAQQKRFDSAAVLAALKDRAERLWQDRRFFQLLNRMLFKAANPDERYRVLEHFYRLPEPTISRFYAAQLTLADKVRILSGRPPVPIGRAIQAMRRKAA